VEGKERVSTLNQDATIILFAYPLIRLLRRLKVLPHFHRRRQYLFPQRTQENILKRHIPLPGPTARFPGTPGAFFYQFTVDTFL
jgi:hypothetical protein